MWHGCACGLSLMAAHDLSRPLRDRLTRNGSAIHDGAIRYMMLRPDVLMGMFDRLPAEMRITTLQALCQSVAENGGKSVGAYLAVAPDNLDQLLRVMIDTAADLGWGKWVLTGNAETGFDVSVDDSPFAAPAERPQSVPQCAAITGILTATARAIWPEGACVEETRCAAQGDAACLCHFRLRPLRD